MLLDEELYLKHYGKKGMKWGQRRAQRKRNNKNQSKSEKTVVALVAAGAAFMGARLVSGSTMNATATIAGGAAAGIAGKRFMDSWVNKNGSNPI